VAGEKAIVSILGADTNVTDIISSRVYANSVVPANATRPYIDYQVISGDPLLAIQGKTGLTHKRIQLNIVAESYASVAALADVVRDALQDYRGTANGETVRAATVEDGPDAAFPQVEGGDKRLHVKQMDCLMWIDE